MATVVARDPLLRGMICLSLAVGFEEDRARVGLAAAIDRLRTALIANDLWLCGDDQLLDGVITGKVSSEQFAEALCSMKRMSLPGGIAH
jgi:hypothetical protein